MGSPGAELIVHKPRHSEFIRTTMSLYLIPNTCFWYVDGCHISRKIFHSGGMAPSEWTRTVRAVRDTAVADYSAPSVNTTRRVVYHPPIAVSLSLRVLSVSYFKWSPWRCGQLWQYVGMGSLGTRLHRDCNAMGDVANISPRVPSTRAPNAILFTNYTHHSKSPDLCGYWQSIARSVRLLSY